MKALYLQQRVLDIVLTAEYSLRESIILPPTHHEKRRFPWFESVVPRFGRRAPKLTMSAVERGWVALEVFNPFQLDVEAVYNAKAFVDWQTPEVSPLR